MSDAAAIRKLFKDKKRIVVKIGSSSLTHRETGRLNFSKLEVLVRELSDLHNQGKDVVLVSSGAIAVGTAALGQGADPKGDVSKKQACAAVGQARLMMIYQQLFSEYNQMAGQILMTKNTMVDALNRRNAKNTFEELLKLGTIPIVNENDTISTYEIQFGDNDTLSAVVAALIQADLLIMLSDVDGLYTDDPRQNPEASFVELVDSIDEDVMNMGKNSIGSGVGTGGMATKLTAAALSTAAGADTVIANGDDFHNIHRIIEGKKIGTILAANQREEFYLIDYIENLI